MEYIEPPKAPTNLKVGERYTIVGMSEFGIGAYAHQVTLTKEPEIKPYAQYREALYLQYRAKKKRKESRLVFYSRGDYAKEVVIYPGWVDVHTDPFTKPEKSSSGCLVSKGKYSSFDRGYLKDAIASVEVEPIYKFGV